MTKKYTHENFDRPSEDMIDTYYESLSKVWLPTMKTEDLLEGHAQSVKLLGREIMIAKLDDEIVAMSNFCPHFQAKLSEGTVEELCGSFEKVVRCRYHGWAFNSKGQCVEIPQLKKGQKIPKAAQIETYKTAIKHDLIWVSLDGNPMTTIPNFPETETPDMVQTAMQYSSPWSTSLVRMVMSALDDYHFPWLHEGILGTRDKPMPPERTITITGNELKSEFTQYQPSNVTNSVNDKDEGSHVNYQMIVDMPNIIRLVKENEDQGRYVVQFFPQPITFDQTAIFWRVSRNYDISPEGEQKIIELERFIQSQDKEHVGSLKPWLMDPTPIKGADDALMAYLKGISKFGMSSKI